MLAKLLFAVAENEIGKPMFTKITWSDFPGEGRVDNGMRVGRGKINQWIDGEMKECE